MMSRWWESAVVYQVYWRSFFDTNGDGIGDLNGVIEKLPYIKSIGVNTIWLNPFYESPDIDGGYDVSDYHNVMPKAGTMEIFEELLAKAKKLGLRIILDVVLNHTSDQHPWFKQSAESKDNPHHDYYIWKDPVKEGTPPNNWPSYFAPSCWTFHPSRGQYYMHSFAPQQPDLNWDNPDVRKGVYEILHFWLKKGIDGFRLDVINLIKKPTNWDDIMDPTDKSILADNHGIHDYLQEMHREVFSHYDAFTVGEVPWVGPKQGLLYVAPDRHELNNLFHFNWLDESGPDWDMIRTNLPRFKAIVQSWEEAFHPAGAYVANVLSNHDHVRAVSRYGNDREGRQTSAKALATLNVALPGITYVYQGEEIGMTSISLPSIIDYALHDVNDANGHKVLTDRFLAEGLSESSAQYQAEQVIRQRSRLNSRSPVHWDASAQAGFTKGSPWLPINPNYPEINVASQESDPNSVLNYYRQLLKLHQGSLALQKGLYKELPNRLSIAGDVHNNERSFVFIRAYQDEKLLIILNLGDNAMVYGAPEEDSVVNATLVMSNDASMPTELKNMDRIELSGWSAAIYKL